MAELPQNPDFQVGHSVNRAIVESCLSRMSGFYADGLLWTIPLDTIQGKSATVGVVGAPKSYDAEWSPGLVAVVPRMGWNAADVLAFRKKTMAHVVVWGFIEGPLRQELTSVTPCSRWSFESGKRMTITPDPVVGLTHFMHFPSDLHTAGGPGLDKGISEMQRIMTDRDRNRFTLAAQAARLALAPCYDEQPRRMFTAWKH